MVLSGDLAQFFVFPEPLHLEVGNRMVPLLGSSYSYLTVRVTGQSETSDVNTLELDAWMQLGFSKLTTCNCLFVLS